MLLRDTTPETLDGRSCTVRCFTSFASPTGLHFDVLTAFNGRDTLMGAGLTRAAALESARAGLAVYFGPAR